MRTTAPANNEKLKYACNRCNTTDHKLTDIVDGKRFRNLYEQGWFRSNSDIGLILALDGGALFKRNGVQVWPVWGLVANLEPKERYTVK